MRKPINEIQKVFQTHNYSLNNIIFDVMKKFKFKSICCRVGFQKEDGYSASEIVTLILLLPLMLLNSVHALYGTKFQKVTDMKKDTIYRLKNNARMPWRALLTAVAKRFQQMTNPEKVLASNSAFILDDTVQAKTGRRIEQISIIHDHVAGKKAYKLGFKNLTLGFFDGKSFTPLDFSLHSEKSLQKARHRKEQFKKERDPRSAGAKRLRECQVNKISNGLDMIKRAVKKGFRARYVLVDSWFSSKEFITTSRQIRQKSLHVICGIRKDKRKYSYNDKTLNAQQLLQTLKKEGKEKRCRKRNTRYFEVVVTYEEVGQVKLYYCRFPYQKEWRLFLSTDTSLSLLNMLEIYSIRWSIEVFFKETKQQLKLGTCQSRDFDAQIAHVTSCYLLYIFLAYFRRLNDYESLGGLFQEIKDDLVEKNLAERLWEMFEELLQIILTEMQSHGFVDLLEFSNSVEYLYIRELFEQSFLSNQFIMLENAG